LDQNAAWAISGHSRSASPRENGFVAAKDDDQHLIPPMIDCARAHCTEGEIVGALREVFGE